MSDILDKRQETALRAVRLAAQACESVRRQLVGPDTLQKKDRSPVTVADFASQAVVCGVLSQVLEQDAVVGEEDAAELRAAPAEMRQKVTEHVRQALGSTLGPISEEQVLDWIDRGGGQAKTTGFWTLDPIDGTKGFLRGEQYAIALAWIEAGRVTLAALGCPGLTAPWGKGVLITAVRGQGARQQPLTPASTQGTPWIGPISASGTADPARARFCESVESGHSDQNRSVRIAQTLGITAPGVRMDSQAKYAAVARGDADIYLRLPTRADYQEKIWDHAAGMLAVEEAGGRVTDITGRPLDFSRGRTLAANQGVIATCGPIHDAVVRAVQAAGA